MPSDVVTNRDLYEAMKDLRGEMFSGRQETQAAIQRLDDKFMTMEAGRLTRAEGSINKLELRDAVLTTKVLALVGIIVILGTAGMNMLVFFLEKKLGGTP